MIENEGATALSFRLVVGRRLGSRVGIRAAYGGGRKIGCGKDHQKSEHVLAGVGEAMENAGRYVHAVSTGYRKLLISETDGGFAGQEMQDFLARVRVV